jgi:hypothetical protein
MDQDEELAKFKWILIAAIAFLVSSYFSYRELKYAVWGATAEATVTRAAETTEMGRRGRRRPMLVVEYTFSDGSTGQRSERDRVPIDWPVPEGTVTVQYLPGVAGASRLAGHSNKFAVWMASGGSHAPDANVWR